MAYVSKLTVRLCKECGNALGCGRRDLSFRFDSSLQVNDAAPFVNAPLPLSLNQLHHCGKKLIRRFNNVRNVDHLRQKR